MASKKRILLQDGKVWLAESEVPMRVVIGLTSDGVDDIGDVEAVELPDSDAEFDREDVICEVHGTDSEIKVVSPATCTVAKVNDVVVSEPKFIGEDPQDEGWLLELEIQNEQELSELF